MTAVTAAARTDATPAAAPAAPLALPSGVKPTPARVLPDRTRALGTYLFMVADAMVLSTIVAAYFAIKDGSSAWPPVDVGVGTYIPSVVTITLAMAACLGHVGDQVHPGERPAQRRHRPGASPSSSASPRPTPSGPPSARPASASATTPTAPSTTCSSATTWSTCWPAVLLLGVLLGRSLVGHFSAEHHDPLRSGVLFFQYSNAVWFAVATVLFVFSRVNG